MRKETRVTVTACCLLFGIAALAQQPPQSTTDEIVGKAVFDVQKSIGGHAMLIPKTPVAFGATRLSLSGADMPEGTAICTVFKRVVATNDQLKANITITVLKCGEYEYGISEVLFDNGKQR